MPEKIKISTDKGEKEVTLNLIKGKHSKEGFKSLTKIQDADGEVNFEAINKYTDLLDAITSDCTGLSIEELDNIEQIEKDKLTSFYHNQIKSKMDFLKPSQKQQDSVSAGKTER